MTAEAWFVLAAAGLLVFVGVVTWSDYQRQAELARVMAGVATRPGAGMLADFTHTVDGLNYILGISYETARQIHAHARFVAAAQRMARGSKAIAEFAPDLLDAIVSMRDLARAVAVVVSVEPVPPSAFRRPLPRVVAAAGQVGHHLLLTGQHRMRWRLWWVTALLRLTLRGLRQSTEAVLRDPAHLPPWDRLETALADLDTASNEAVVTASALIMALDALELGLPVQQRA